MKHSVFSLSFILLTCSCLPKDYKKFQDFDEYSMKGIPAKGKLEYPYVAIKESNDKLSVVIIRPFFYHRTIEYTHKGNYWYNYEKYQIKYEENCQCDTTPIYYHRYIFNDTIITYGFREFKVPPIDDFLWVDTRTDMIVFDTKWLNISGDRDTLAVLKSYINLYKDSTTDFSSHNRSISSSFYKKKKTSKDNYIQLRDP